MWSITRRAQLEKLKCELKQLREGGKNQESVNKEYVGQDDASSHEREPEKGKMS